MSRLVIFLLFSVTMLSGCGQPKGQKVVLVKDVLSIVLPKEFKPLPAEIMSTKFPLLPPGEPFYGIEDSSVVIGARIREYSSKPTFALTEYVVGEAIKLLEQSGGRLIDRTNLILGARRWVKFSFITEALDTQIYNEQYWTPHEKGFLVMSFNSSVDLKDKYLPGFSKSLSTLSVK